MNDLDVDLPVPVAGRPPAGVVDGNLRDPVDRREAGDGIRPRDRVEDDAMAMRAEADKRCAGPDRHARGDAAPHDRATPLNWRLPGMHLRAHGRMETIRPDQKRTRDLQTIAVVRLDQRPDAEPVGVVAVAGDRHARSDGASAEAFEDGPVEEHLEPPAMHGILRPLVASVQTPGSA